MCQLRVCVSAWAGACLLWPPPVQVKYIQRGTRTLQYLCSEGKFRKEMPLTARVGGLAWRACGWAWVRLGRSWGALDGQAWWAVPARWF